jgi:hypothetical protein
VFAHTGYLKKMTEQEYKELKEEKNNSVKYVIFPNFPPPATGKL